MMRFLKPLRTDEVRAALRLVCVLAVVLLGAGAASAQNAQIMRASVLPVGGTPPTQWNVSILFDTPFAKTDFTRVSIVDVGSNQLIDVLAASGPVISFNVNKGGTASIVLPAATLNPASAYAVNLLAATNTPSGKPELLIKTLDFSPKPRERSPKSVDTKDDANVYVAGEATGASGTKVNYTADIKVKIPFYGNIFKKGDKLSPFFELNASTNPKADPDSLNFGLELQTPFRTDARYLTNVFWLNSAKVEAERDFDNANALWDSRLVFGVPPFGEKTMLTLRPFFGIELGKNIKSPVVEARKKAIVRPLAGATMKLTLPAGTLPGVGKTVLSSSYIRRWPLRNEVSFEEDDDGNLSAVTFGKSPRDFVETKLTFKFNQFFGTYIGHEWGEVPPSYKLTDHRFKMGFVYSFALGVE
jgi:hypothetical protein